MKGPTAFSMITLALCLGITVLSGVGADSFTFSGDQTSVVLTEGKERTILRGNAVVVSNTFELRADEIELSGTDFRYADTRGSVEVIDTKRNVRIAAEALRFDRVTENARAEGAVQVEDLDNELLLKGEYLETRSGGDLIFVQTAVRILKEDLTARTQFLRYRRDEDVLELSGFPVVFWNGDEYRATRIVMNLETDEIEMQGRVQGAIVLEEEEEEEEGEAVNEDAPNQEAADGGPSGQDQVESDSE